MLFYFRIYLLRLEWSVIVACSCTAVDQYGRTRDKRFRGRHKQLRDVRDLARDPETTCGIFREHILVEVTARSPLDSLRHNALFIAALSHLISVKSVADISLCF